MDTDKSGVKTLGQRPRDPAGGPRRPRTTVLVLLTDRLQKEARLCCRALGSALPIFATAILGAALPQSLLAYFQVFECCSQTTAVLLKAEPKHTTCHCPH